MFVRTLTLTAIVLSIASNQLAIGDQTTPDTPAATELPESPAERFFALDSSRLTGDWGGVRTDLEERGIKFSAFLNDYYMGVFKGGTNTKHAYRNSASIDIFATFDFDELGLIPDGDLLVHLQSYWGNGVNPWTGALRQVTDDADGDLGGVVAQLWYRHHFLDRQLALRIGYLDYQTIIDKNAYANSEDKQFTNQALDNNPLLPLGPGLGACLTYRPTDWYTLIIGALDAQTYPALYKPGFSTAFHDEAWFMAFVENGFHVKLDSTRGPLAGNYRLGMLYDPTRRSVYTDPNDPPRTRGDDFGAYASLDQMIYREMRDSDQGLGMFARLGFRHSHTNRISQFYSGGFEYKGLIPTRDQDVLGLGCTAMRRSDKFHKYVDDRFDTETVYELYYKVEVNKWLAITPDLQYIDDPGLNADIRHTIVGGLRVRLSF